MMFIMLKDAEWVSQAYSEPVLASSNISCLNIDVWGPEFCKLFNHICLSAAAQKTEVAKGLDVN